VIERGHAFAVLNIDVRAFFNQEIYPKGCEQLLISGVRVFFNLFPNHYVSRIFNSCHKNLCGITSQKPFPENYKTHKFLTAQDGGLIF
jgi:hypothetical protein